MRISLIAVGTRMPAWVDAGFNEYARRLPPQCRLELKPIHLGHRGKTGNTHTAMAAEGERMLAAINPAHTACALEVGGNPWSTEQLAGQLKKWLASGADLALLVGGPDGLAADVRARAQIAWSLSPLTLPHGLVRVVIAEQIYRAWSLLHGHPYHRA